MDLLQFVVTVLPTRGALKALGGNSSAVTAVPATFASYAAYFTPDADTANAFEYTRFSVKASDGVAFSEVVEYTVRVLPTNTLPALDVTIGSLHNLTLYEDTLLSFGIPFTDSDSVFILFFQPDRGELSPSR